MKAIRRQNDIENRALGSVLLFGFSINKYISHYLRTKFDVIQEVRQLVIDETYICNHSSWALLLKLNVNKTLPRLLGPLLNILFTFKSRPVPRDIEKVVLPKVCISCLKTGPRPR